MTTFADIVADAPSALLDAWQADGQWPPAPEPKGGWTPPRLVAAIRSEVAAAILADPRLTELLAGALLPTMRADMSASEVAAAIIRSLGETK